MLQGRHHQAHPRSRKGKGHHLRYRPSRIERVQKQGGQPDRHKGQRAVHEHAEKEHQPARIIPVQQPYHAQIDPDILPRVWKQFSLSFHASTSLSAESAAAVESAAAEPVAAAESAAASSGGPSFR